VDTSPTNNWIELDPGILASVLLLGVNDFAQFFDYSTSAASLRGMGAGEDGLNLPKDELRGFLLDSYVVPLVWSV
jgi:hypothetical protein